MKVQVTLVMIVEAESEQEAGEIGMAAGQHLFETFNDDDSIDSKFGIIVNKVPTVQ